jgi:hypothetical protein
MRDEEMSAALLRAENAKLREQVQRLEQRLSEREHALHAALARGALAEEQLARLTRLYVAHERLQQARAPDQVLEAIQEIVANIIGSEQLAIWRLDRAAGTLSLVSSMGIEPAPLRTVPLGQGIIGRVALTGEPFVAATPPPPGSLLPVNACVPLSMEDRVQGAIAIFALLPQKLALEDMDRELLTLLSEQAAPALHRAELFSQDAPGNE